MRARLIAFFLLAAAGSLSYSTANADIIRCSGANGNTLYTDSSCPAGMHAVGVTSLPQACATDDCEYRREREAAEARERVRAEKEQLAAVTAERHKREIEDRWLDEARYEAELRSAEAAQAATAEAAYPAYPVIGIPVRCGKHCLPNPHRHVGNDNRHDHMKGGNQHAIRTAGNERVRMLRVPRSYRAMRPSPATSVR